MKNPPLQSTAEKVAAWLRTLPGMMFVFPALLYRTGRERGGPWAGALYFAKRTTPKDSGAPAAGRSHVDAVLYMVGVPPNVRAGKSFQGKIYAATRNTAYQITGDVSKLGGWAKRDWYLGGYYSAAAVRSPEHKQVTSYHPFGATFMLMPWRVPSGEPIDYGEPRRYAREYLTLQLLGGGAVVKANPYPAEHAARLLPPRGFIRMRRRNDEFGHGIHAIYGIRRKKGPRGGRSVLQAIRFDATRFTPAQAKAWLRRNEKYRVIRFERATGRYAKHNPQGSIVWQSVRDPAKLVDAGKWYEYDGQLVTWGSRDATEAQLYLRRLVRQKKAPYSAVGHGQQKRQPPAANPRRVTARAVQFFVRQAGYAFDPKIDKDAAAAKLRNARALAAAEVWAATHGYSFDWEIDPQEDSSSFSEEKPAWQLWTVVLHDPEGKVVQSLGAVDFGRDGRPETDPYRRVVQAELANEEMPRKTGSTHYNPRGRRIRRQPRGNPPRGRPIRRSARSNPPRDRSKPDPRLVRSGAAAPFNQLGVRPGPVKLAQFRAALAYTQTPPLRSQNGKGENAIAYVKLFDPAGAATWLITEFDPATNEAFGWVDFGDPQNAELGYINIEELATTPGRMGIGMEIDNWFRPGPLRLVKTNPVPKGIRPENRRMQAWLAQHGIQATPKFIHEGSLRGTWRLYNLEQKWTPELAAQLNALGFTHNHGEPLGPFSGNGGIFSVFVRGHNELLHDVSPNPRRRRAHRASVRVRRIRRPLHTRAKSWIIRYQVTPKASTCYIHTATKHRAKVTIHHGQAARYSKATARKLAAFLQRRHRGAFTAEPA